MRTLLLVMALCAVARAQPDSSWQFRLEYESRQICHSVVTDGRDFVLLGYWLSRQSDADADILFCRVGHDGSLIHDSASGQSGWDEAVLKAGRNATGELWGVGADGPEGLASHFALMVFGESGGVVTTHDIGLLFDPEFGVDTTSDGGYILAHSGVDSLGTDAAQLTKLDDAGELQWDRQLPLYDFSRLTDVVSLRDGGVAVGVRFHDMLFTEFDALGDTIWVRYLDLSDDYLQTLCRAPRGGYFAGGYVRFWDTWGWLHPMVIRVSETGDSLWSWYEPDTGHVTNRIFDVIPTLDSGFVAVGTADEGSGPGGGADDVVLWKFSDGGRLEWRGQYGEPGVSEEGMSVVQTEDGGFAIAGNSWSDVTASDFLLIRTERDPSLDARPGPPRALNFRLDQNYPNPFNANTTITFSLVRPGAVNLSVFDLMGRRVRTLLDETARAGEHQIQFAASGLPSGVYIYRIITGDHTTSRKLLLLK